MKDIITENKHLTFPFPLASFPNPSLSAYQEICIMHITLKLVGMVRNLSDQGQLPFQEMKET